MIWVHTFGIGKFGSKTITNIHYSAERAEESRRVLGGKVKVYREVE